jgi:hypothetical protein
LVVVDISPVSSTGLLTNFFPNLIDVMKSINFDGIDNVSKAKTLAKAQILKSGIVRSMEGMNFILMNIGVRPNKTVGWVYNLEVLKEAFQSIASFPSEMADKTFNGPTLFIGGEESSYIP